MKEIYNFLIKTKFSIPFVENLSDSYVLQIGQNFSLGTLYYSYEPNNNK